MSLLTIVQNVALETGVTVPTAVISSNDEQVKRILALVKRELYHLRLGHNFPQLIKEGSVTLAASTDSYALPADFGRFHHRTHWDNTNKWELVGPITGQEAQALNRGVITSFPRRKFRVKGYTSAQFFVFPTPSASEAGEILYFEYFSKVTQLPVEWTASTVFLASSYCSYNGNVYSTVAGGTSGATPPTHTSSSASDGGVTWVYESDPYLDFTADTDFCVLPEKLVELGVAWRFLRLNGQAYEDRRMEWRDALMKEVSALRGARTLSLVKRGTGYLISSGNVPDTNYGA